MSIFTAVKHKG